MKAVVCPICEGRGQICVGIDPYSTSAAPLLQPCHGCGGKGWVVVPDVLVYSKKEFDNYPPV